MRQFEAPGRQLAWKPLRAGIKKRYDMTISREGAVSMRMNAHGMLEIRRYSKSYGHTEPEDHTEKVS